MDADETIAAIATPIGVGGIGVIKISGPRSRAIAEHLFRRKEPDSTPLLQPYHLHLGYIFDPAKREVLDEVLLTFMPGPASYTREDVIEIQCHSGFVVLESILQLVIRQEGVRLAEPGEFTRRAFLNGRLDLVQVEAILDIITARTGAGLAHAAAQLAGKLRERISRLKQTVVTIAAHIEAAIDFPEEDISALSSTEIRERLMCMRDEIQAFLDTFEEGRRGREGVQITILGRPNVGKSSLLNALLEEERAIVYHTPGTTRDAIEETVTIRGIAVTFVDTAGLPLEPVRDPVEARGTELTRVKAVQADVILLVLDGSHPLTENDRLIVEEFSQKTMLVVVNKVDLPQQLDMSTLAPVLHNQPWVSVSAKYYQNIGDLRDALYERIVRRDKDLSGVSVLINRVRHKNCLERVKAGLDRVLEGIDGAISMECVALDLREVLDNLGDLVGETTPEDILDQIFSEFCIGK